MRHGRPFFSIGFNYHPSPTGCRYWQAWDPDQIDHDFRKMAEFGFNTVRFFVFWADFEPAAGVYDEEKVGRLHTLVALAARYDLQCIPSLLTIWMNGQLFDLNWREGRDLWRDPFIIRREQAFVEYIARALRGSPNVLAYDLGDEVIHVDAARSHALSAAAVREWWRLLADEIRRADPQALVFQGNEASAVMGGHHFRPEHAAALDLLGLHGFPVWSPIAIESTASYKASNFVPFLAGFGRAYAPVLVDELGSYGCDERTAADYLRAAAHSLFVNGVAGVIVWCWQDFASREKPYALHPNERFVGLLTTDGRSKPAMNVFRSVADAITTRWSSFSVAPAPIALYAPPAWQHSHESYLDSRQPSTAALFYSYLLLKRAHLPFEFTHGPLDRYQLVICPSMSHLSLDEQDLLRDYVAAGGTLYYSCLDHLSGFGGEELFGIELRDFTMDVTQMRSFRWQGHSYDLCWPPRNARWTRVPVIRSMTADVLAEFPNGTPALTCRRSGKGKAYYLNAPFESQLDEPFRLDAAPWHALYAALARDAGIRRELDADHPAVEVAVLRDGFRRCGFAINHAPHPLETRLCRCDAAGTATEVIHLRAKEVYTLTWEVDES